MEIAVLTMLVLFISFILYKNLNGKEKENGILALRKKQSELNFRENALKKKFEKMASEKVTVSKRYKLETLCLQAGYNITYGEFKLISFASAIVLPIIILIALNNAFLAILGILIGYILPNQAIRMRRNKRIAESEKQIGSFLQIVIERYKTTNEFTGSLKNTVEDFEGQEPIYTNLKLTVIDIENGMSTSKALDNLARRTGNKYLSRFTDFYKIVSELGTQESRNKLLNQAYIQYDEDRKIKSKLNKEIQGPKSEAYLILCGVPGMALYQIFTNKDYIPFMTETLFGQVGSTVIICISMACLWFINTQIGKPLD